MNAEFMHAVYVAARHSIEEKYPVMFEGANQDKSRQWRVSTWSKNIRTQNRLRKNQQINY